MSVPIELQPYDEHNQRLEANVHPPDWANPTPDGPYDLIVVGAGTAGLVTAAIASSLGAKTALVERNLMGGDCLNVGCVPSKGLLSAARAAAAVKGSGEFGVHVEGDVRVDFGQVMERMRKLRADISPADSAKRFSEEKGVAIHLGDAEFTSGDKIRVGEQTLCFKKAVIATGARAAAPPIDGLDSVDYLNNESLFSLTELPKSLGVIGAGPIGAEMTQAFARFGSEVHVINVATTALPREDPDAGRIVQTALERDGVQFHSATKNLRLSDEQGRVRMQAEASRGPVDVVVDKLLVAVGRAPNVDGLGLEAVGVEYDPRKGVQVDDHYQTTNPKIYAAGDVCSPYKFTHAADFMARSVVANALFTPWGVGKRRASSLVIPWATYTSPEVAHVGLSESEANDKNLPITTYRVDLEHVDRAILEGATEGFVKVHVAEGTDKILGATIVAENAGDMIGSISIAMTNGIGLGKIAASIHPYPTQGEAIRKVGDLYSRTKLTPFAARFLKWMLKLST